MLHHLKEALHILADLKGLIQWGGVFLVCAIMFVETGLFVGFVLPGDSLLVTAGIFAAAGHRPVGSRQSLPALSQFTILTSRIHHSEGCSRR